MSSNPFVAFFGASITSMMWVMIDIAAYYHKAVTRLAIEESHSASDQVLDCSPWSYQKDADALETGTPQWFRLKAKHKSQMFRT